MKLLASGSLWWLLLGGLIILLYLLKLKRKPRVVPSLFLWRQALEELEANAPFRRLRRNLLLILQLMALLAMVFALARPAIYTSSGASGTTVIVLDATASMSARDEEGSSRLERARQLAREIVGGLRDGERAALLELSSRVAIRSPLTSDRGELRKAIDSIAETDTSGDLDDVLMLAEQIAKSEPEAGIVVISDGNGRPDTGVSQPRSAESPAPSADPALPTTPSRIAGKTPVRFISVGQRGENIGIVALNTRISAARRGQELFASLANFSPRDLTTEVQLLIEGRLIDVRSVSMKANDRIAVVFEVPPALMGMAELRLPVDDDLLSDNSAFAYLSDVRPLRVAVASDNPFLFEALSAHPDLSVFRTDSLEDVDVTTIDCVVADRHGFTGGIGELPALLIDPADSEGSWQGQGSHERPSITSVNRGHPVNSYLSYDDLHIEAMVTRKVAGWMTPIVTTDGGALIWAGDDGRRRVVLLGFSLRDSDLPLKVEFPILISNSINWITQRDADDSNRAIRTGQPITIRGAGDVSAVKTPEGAHVELGLREGAAIFAETRMAGVYTVENGEPFAASLLNAFESDTAPRDSILVRTERVNRQSDTYQSEREVWWLAVLAGLVIAGVEWWAYHRRVS